MAQDSYFIDLLVNEIRMAVMAALEEAEKAPPHHRASDKAAVEAAALEAVKSAIEDYEFIK